MANSKQEKPVRDDVSGGEAARMECLCRQAQLGDRRAEEALIGRMMAPVKRLLQRLLWDKGEVDDLTQDTLVICMCKLRQGQIHHPRAFHAFALTVARNLVINHVRSRQREAATVPLELLGDHQALAGPNSQEPLQQLLLTKDYKDLLSAIAHLTRVRDRLVLRRYYFIGDSVAVLCRELDLTEAHFYRVLFRARQRLHKWFKARSDGGIA